MSSELAPRPCPDCHTAMKPHDAGDLRLDVCESCGGVWYDSGVFSKMIHEGPSGVDHVEAQEPPQIQKIEASRVQLCPVCQVPLNSYGYTGNQSITLSGCNKCGGIFMEPASLQRLDARQHQYAGDDPAHPIPPEVAASFANLDGQTAANLFKARMAQYNWNYLMTPNWF